MWGTIYHTRGTLYANGLHMLRGGYNGWDLSRQSVFLAMMGCATRYSATVGNVGMEI